MYLRTEKIIRFFYYINIDILKIVSDGLVDGKEKHCEVMGLEKQQTSLES